eukprot:COSAG06_NODE_5567_length_3397_cov_3.112492_2_plen_226_part_00
MDSERLAGAYRAVFAGQRAARSMRPKCACWAATQACWCGRRGAGRHVRRTERGGAVTLGGVRLSLSAVGDLKSSGSFYKIMCRLLTQWAILRSSELFFRRRLQTSSSLRERYGCVVLLPPGVPRACPTHPRSFSARRSGRPAAAPLPSERRRPVLFLSLSLSLAPEPTPPLALVSSCVITSALGAEKQLQRSGTVRDSQGQSGSLTVALLSPYCLLLSSSKATSN